ncbi:MAG TPA: CdaR family protein [Candidatus Sulfotelmatobacter sp.]|nr:CdaR family protein [Candidatus Sulfotelmatobacter sp.]
MQAWVGKNLGLKLLSLLLACVLWALVVGEQKVDVILTVPLELALPPSMVLINEPVDAVEVHLRGPRTLVTGLTPRDIGLTSVPSKFLEGETVLSLRSESVRVPRGIQVVDVTPRRIRVVVDAVGEREVDVSPRLEGRPATGFVVRQVKALPARVGLVGPKSELRRLSRVATQPVAVDGQRAPFSRQVGLEPLARQVRPQNEQPITVDVDIAPGRS